jgi:hypothetical protein
MFGRREENRFDRVELASDSGPPARMTAAEFKAMPLAQRVRAIMAGRLRFFRGGSEVSMKEALDQ